MLSMLISAHGFKNEVYSSGPAQREGLGGL